MHSDEERGREREKEREREGERERDGERERERVREREREREPIINRLPGVGLNHHHQSHCRQSRSWEKRRWFWRSINQVLVLLHFFLLLESSDRAADRVCCAGLVQIRMYPTHVILAARVPSCGHALMPCMQIIDRTQITNFRQFFNVKMHYTVARQNSDYLKVPISDKFLMSKCMTRTVDRIQIVF